MILRTIDEWIKTSGGRFIYDRKPENTIKFHMPITIDPIEELFQPIVRKECNLSRCFCAEVHNVHVIDGRVFDQTLSKEMAEFSTCGSMTMTERTCELQNAVHLVDVDAGENYWHWMTTALAKMVFVPEMTKDVRYIVNSLNCNFVLDSLTKLGINPSLCIETYKHKNIYCKNLMLPSPLRDNDSVGTLFLRDKFRHGNLFKNRLYISRRGRRRILNESDVVSLLSPLGFQVVHCENMSFEEQVKAFSCADIVVAPHGAGLTNSIFVHPNSKILELRSPKYFGSCYWKLCNNLGFQYYSLFGEGIFQRRLKTFQEAFVLTWL